jgi:hypothetical protein
VNTILERGYSTKEIILKPKEIIIKKIVEIDIEK